MNSEILLTENSGDTADWLLFELFIAFLAARKGKQKSTDEFRLEVDWMVNLINLRDDILHRRYKPSRGIAFITRRPVIREIFAAPFRDRIVHHFIYNHVMSWWDRRLIYDSYSCRVGKGTEFAIRRLDHHIRSVSDNYTKEAYAIKLDIEGYFMSLPRSGLYERAMWGLNKQYAGNPAMRDLLAYLWGEIIFDDPTRGVRKRGKESEWDDLPPNKSLFNQPPGRGIVIGNLTSQVLSNMYLDPLDRYITMQLGYRHYGRYVDDFYIIVTAEEYEQAKKDVPLIEEFLAKMGLRLHPRKRYMQEVKKGVPYLGVVVYPGHIVPAKRIMRNFVTAAEECAEGLREIESIISYLGYFNNINGRKFCKKIFEKYGWDFEF